VLRHPAPGGRDLQQCLDDEPPPQPSDTLVSLDGGGSAGSQPATSASSWIRGRAPRQPAPRAARATSRAVVQRGHHLRSNAAIDSGSDSVSLVLSSRSDAASAYRRFLAGAATVTLIIRNAAGTSDCVTGRRSRVGSVRQHGRTLVAIRRPDSSCDPLIGLLSCGVGGAPQGICTSPQPDALGLINAVDADSNDARRIPRGGRSGDSRWEPKNCHQWRSEPPRRSFSPRGFPGSPAWASK
jgi:hypothetical protein